ncbi:uncharacterized protein FIBRA_09083 [Fibroporia radiculosa]|uniref:Uncharacterized protein n=1 Tax=Fibroporia radiculosa TaxID=599839 RepID=J4H5I2_9APHY|nr:uncharacterized protein FIBRA_09083 [Fibroporia radiculosa]CCM06784.1 predicted protein [Fibroporia radiculosa]
MPAERNTRPRTNNANSSTPRRPLAPARKPNTPTSGAQRVPTPYPPHIQVLEEHFNAGIVEMPTPIRPTINLQSRENSDDSSMEFLSEGGFRYPFPPIPNVTCRPFLIPGPSDSSHNDAVLLHQFPGPLELSHNQSDTTPGSYHVAPPQTLPSQSSVLDSSSMNPNSPIAATTDSPSMPPLASDISDGGSLDYPTNLHLLASTSEYVTASEGHSDNPQEFLVYSDDMVQRPSNAITQAWRSIPFNTSTPIQDVDPLERVLPHFPGAYTHSLSHPPMGVSIHLNPAFGL